MMIQNLNTAIESTRRDEALCLTFAIGLHLLMLLWNPIILKSHWQAPHDFVTVEVVEQPTPGAPAAPVEAVKMSLMDTLKNMLSKPVEEIAHVAPEQPVIRQPQAAPAVPMLSERSRPLPMHPAFNPKGQEEDLAALNSPNPIAPTMGAKVTDLAPTGPTLKTKAFGGIRTKDLPFEVSSNQEGVATGGSSAIPIAIGNSSAKAALGYEGPALKDSSKTHMGVLPTTGRGLAPTDVAALGATGPAPISLSGTGGSGTAPTGVNAGSSLQQRGGGATIFNRAFGGGIGSGAGNGIEGIPSAAQQLDQQLGEASSNGTKASAHKTQKGFEIAGPLTNRPIVHKVIPEYPDWAEEQGIIGSVRLYFTVTPEGKVRSYIRVTKTTGYPQLDQLGIDALKQWQFAPLNAEEEGKGEWGIITFNFSLSSQ